MDPIGNGPAKRRPGPSTYDSVPLLAPFTKRLRNNTAGLNRCCNDLKSYRVPPWRPAPNKLNPATPSPAKSDCRTAPIRFGLHLPCQPFGEPQKLCGITLRAYATNAQNSETCLKIGRASCRERR